MLNWKVGQNKGQFYGEGKKIRVNKFCLSKKEKIMVMTTLEKDF